MEFVLKNYNNEFTTHTIAESTLKEAQAIILLTLSGDEVLYVYLPDGDYIKFDPSESKRTLSLFDNNMKLLTIEELARLHREE